MEKNPLNRKQGGRKKTLGLVLPIFKNEESLGELFEQLIGLENSLNQRGVTLNVIFVIDGTPDDSLAKIIGLRKLYQRTSWKILELARNFGQVNALLAGLEWSNHDLVVCMTADLQDPPNLILDFVRAHRDGAEIVIGVRKERHENWYLKTSSKIAYNILRKIDPNLPVGGFDYFFMSKTAKERLIRIKGEGRFLQADIVNLPYEIRYLPYIRDSRRYGRSSYTFWGKFWLLFDSILDISEKPMRRITTLGFIALLFTLLMSIISLYGYYFGKPIRGFTTIYLTLLGVSSVQLISLGMIGEYVAKIYKLTRSKPNWVIKKIL